MIIREAQHEDLDTIANFQRLMAMETEKIALDDNVLKKGIENLFSDPTKGKYYVAVIGKDIIACLMTTFEWSDWRNGTILWIQSVFVDKSSRGKGAYKKMYEHIQNIVAADELLKGIRLYVDKDNLPAQSVYSKLGMNGEHYKVFEWMK
jgi:ribosomal protein S18 acetylase RimI-like enzyme